MGLRLIFFDLEFGISPQNLPFQLTRVFLFDRLDYI